MDTRKTAILQALRTFARSRPGLDFANYGDVRAYRSESRDITRNLQHAQSMLDAIAWRDSISADSILQASHHSFSGRLTINENPAGVFTIDYCTGQYYPTEYRRAVCAVLSSVLWDYFCANGAESGDDIRRMARRELSRTVSSAWFR